VEVVVAQAVSTALMIPNIKKVKQNLTTIIKNNFLFCFMVNNGSPGVSTLGLFFCKKLLVLPMKNSIFVHN
jgi:hypothetical protein